MTDIIINLLYIAWAGIFFTISLDTIKDNPELYHESPPIAWIASAIWTIFWPLSAAVIVHNMMESK